MEAPLTRQQQFIRDVAANSLSGVIAGLITGLLMYWMFWHKKT